MASVSSSAYKFALQQTEGCLQQPSLGGDLRVTTEAWKRQAQHQLVPSPNSGGNVAGTWRRVLRFLGMASLRAAFSSALRRAATVSSSCGRMSLVNLLCSNFSFAFLQGEEWPSGRFQCLIEYCFDTWVVVTTHHRQKLRSNQGAFPHCQRLTNVSLLQVEDVGWPATSSADSCFKTSGCFCRCSGQPACLDVPSFCANSCRSSSVRHMVLQAASSSSVSANLRFLPAARLPGGSSLQAAHQAGVLTLCCL